MTETITIDRAEYDAMRQRLEDLEDALAFAEARARNAGHPTVSGESVERLVNGENPVKVLREERGMTQRELGEAAGLSTSMVSEIENGNRKPSIDKAGILARTLGVDMDVLFGFGG